MFNLQDSRRQLSELQMENSILKAEAMNRSHKEKGNSLFGEVIWLSLKTIFVRETAKQEEITIKSK